MRTSLSGICLIAPEEYGNFEIHVSDMLSLRNQNNQYDVLSEVRKVKDLKLVCLFGADKNLLIRDHFEGTGSKVITLPGSHHFNNNYVLIVESILKNINISNIIN